MGGGRFVRGQFHSSSSLASKKVEKPKVDKLKSRKVGRLEGVGLSGGDCTLHPTWQVEKKKSKKKTS